ncbi:MAG: hypothetical protein MP439_00735 [Ferrimicrobium sp.]|jgi:hypothetical protein|nr:hypothetical protein [Ferrimicrobium sp.]
MLVSLVSGKSIIAGIIAITGGIGTTVMIHDHTAAKPAKFTAVTHPTSTRSAPGRSNSGRSSDGRSTSQSVNDSTTVKPVPARSTPIPAVGQSTTTTKATTPASVNHGILSGASLHGLCIAYRAHLMMSTGAMPAIEHRLAQSNAFVELAEYATSQGETVPILCATQGGVPMTRMPAGQSGIRTTQQPTASSGSTSFSASTSSVLGNRP